MTERESVDDAATRASELIAARAAARRAGTSSDALSDVSEQQPVAADAVAAASPDEHPRGLVAFMRRNMVYIASSAGLIIAFAILLVIAGSLMTGCSSEKPTEEEPAYASPYDWTKLELSGDRLSYVVDGEVKSRIGVDVSENQHEIDWNAVADDDVDFAIVRVGYRGATEGDLYLDEQFWANLDGARAAGLDCGAYFFSQAQSVDEAVEEADFALTYLNGTPLEYPIAFDSEEVYLGMDASRTTGLTNEQMTAIAQAFCRRIEEAGYRAMVYGNGIDMARYNYGGIADYPVWWAEYDALFPNHDLDIAMWQYTNAGEVAGIPASADLNIDLSSVFAS